MESQVKTAFFSSPLGSIRFELNDRDELIRLIFLENVPPDFATGKNDQALRKVVEQLEEYFAGQRKDFTLAVAPHGTPFQQRVWQELLRIPFGQTINYAQLAEKIGQPSAVRAVATANAANPICILIPCHRVIGSDGSLTGYAYGLERKQRLLELEGAWEKLQGDLFSF